MPPTCGIATMRGPLAGGSTGRGSGATFAFDPKYLDGNNYLARYTPLDGVRDTLKPQGQQNLFYQDGEWVDWDLNPYRPTGFVLTAEDGTIYTYHDTKLVSVQDTSNNSVTFSETSTAISISCSRDPNLSIQLIRASSSEPITRIVQANHPDVTYAYTGGLLTGVTDRNGKTTGFGYATGTMIVTSITGPGQSVPLIRNEYDNDGRLTRHIDADGNSIVYEHRLGERQEVVTDRNGNPTVYEYEERGLVTAVTDPMGRTTRYEYDDHANQTAVVDPLQHRTEYEYDSKGHVTLVRDPLKHETKTSYDEGGRVLTTTDALNRVTTNVYDSKGHLSTTTNALQVVTATNTYNADGSLQTSTDELGNVTSYEYDGSGRRKHAIHPDGSHSRWLYDAQGNLEWESIQMTASEDTIFQTGDRSRVATHYTYDNNGRVTETQTPKPKDSEAVITSSVSYTDLGQEGTRTDGRGLVTRNVYDRQGRLTEVDAAFSTDEATSVSYTYDANGQRIAEKDEEERVTHFRYDGAGRLIRTTYPDGTFTATAYDLAGRQTGTTDRNGNVTSFEYDAAGRQSAVIDAANRRSLYSYDPVGNLETVTDPAQHVTTYHYDALNRRYQTDYTDSTSTSTQYDSASYTDPNCNCTLHGRVQREIDQLGRTTEFRYDYAGRLIEVHLPGISTPTSYTYDVRGNRIKQTDALGHHTDFDFDRLSRLREKHYPGGVDVESYEYDADGNVASKVTPNGTKLVFGYDKHNRLTLKNIDPADSSYPPWSISYSPSGQRSSVSRNGESWTWTYEPLTARMATFTDPFNRELKYSYDGNGNRTRLEVLHGSDDWATNFEYDVLNRLSKVTDRLNGETDYTYGPKTGTLDQVLLPNATKALFNYDDLNRVKKVEQRSPSDSLLASFEYTLGLNGRREGLTEKVQRSSLLTSSLAWGYDSLDRLTSETRTGQLSPYSLAWYYDDVGNRTRQTRDGDDRYYQYDVRDRLTCESSQDACTGTTYVSYGWDANGNMTRRSANQTELFTWDADNRLANYNPGSGSTTDFGYDFDGIRYKRVVGGSQGTHTDYLVDSNRPYADVLEEWGGTGRQRDLGMEYGYGAALLWQIDHAAPGEPKRYLHADAQLSTRLLTDDMPSVTDDLAYEAFGADVAPPTTLPTVYRYTAQQADATTHGYYLRARYFDPRTPRFLSEDPIPSSVLVQLTTPQAPRAAHRISLASIALGSGTLVPLRTTRPVASSRYAYARDDPMDYYDPSGKDAAAIGGVLVVLVVLACLAAVGYMVHRALKAMRYIYGEPLIDKCVDFGRVSAATCESRNTTPLDTPESRAAERLACAGTVQRCVHMCNHVVFYEIGEFSQAKMDDCVERDIAPPY